MDKNPIARYETWAFGLSTKVSFFFFVEQFESQKQSLSQPRDKALNFRGELVILSLSLAKLLTKHTLIHNPCHLTMLGTKFFPTGRRAVHSFLSPLMQLKFGKLKLS